MDEIDFLSVELTSKEFLSRLSIVKLDLDHFESFPIRSKIGKTILGHSLPPRNNFDFCNPRADNFLSEMENSFVEFSN